MFEKLLSVDRGCVGNASSAGINKRRVVYYKTMACIVWIASTQNTLTSALVEQKGTRTKLINHRCI
jgi:hypothetical protein